MEFHDLSWMYPLEAAANPIGKSKNCELESYTQEGHAAPQAFVNNSIL